MKKLIYIVIISSLVLLAQDNSGLLQRQVFNLRQENAKLKQQIAELNYRLAPCDFKNAIDEEKKATQELDEFNKPKEVKKP